MESHWLVEVDRQVSSGEVSRQMHLGAVQIVRLIQVILVVLVVGMRSDVLVHLHELGIA